METRRDRGRSRSPRAQWEPRSLIPTALLFVGQQLHRHVRDTAHVAVVDLRRDEMAGAVLVRPVMTSALNALGTQGTVGETLIAVQMRCAALLETLVVGDTGMAVVADRIAGSGRHSDRVAC